MSSSRDIILGRIRASLGREKPTQTDRDSLQQWDQDKSVYIRPAFDSALLDRFVAQLEGVAGSFESVADQASAYDALTRHLQRLNLPLRLVAAPALADWAWPESFEVRFGGTTGDDLVAVTGCFAAVAESGSVVLLSGPDSPTGLNFLPDYHVVFVKASQLVSHIEDVWPLLRQQPDTPRTVNFISGPSKTADVEQTLQIGAHGPRSFHVIYIEND